MKRFLGQRVIEFDERFVYTDSGHLFVDGYFKAKDGEWRHAGTFADLADAKRMTQYYAERHDRLGEF